GASSIAGKLGHPLCSAYSASKFAVRGLTQTAALELGRHKITVNSYAPGAINIPSRTCPYAGLSLNHGSNLDSESNCHIDRQPIKHDGQPEDVASIVSYLASKEAHFITGEYMRSFFSCLI
ncbi:hypothetical protein EV363DRAFT_1163803, partial [Boletus edulis]